MDSIPTNLLRTALRLEHPEDDPEVARLVAAAVSMIEGQTGRRLSRGEGRLFLDRFEDRFIPADPFHGVSSVVYLDPAGVQQTLPTTAYRVVREGGVPIIRFVDLGGANLLEGTVEVVFDHGYELPPADLVQAVIALVGAWWNNPEALSPIELRRVPYSAEVIIDSYRLRGLLA